MKNLKKIKGDASFRVFFRKKNKDFTSIFVFAKKEKFRNLVIYDAINKILIKNDILAPALLSENYKKNYIEIEDFGDETFFKVLKKKKNKLFYFKKIIQTLKKVQSIKTKNTIDFNKNYYKMPNYDEEILIKEANLFCDWYIKFNLKKKKRLEFVKKFRKVVKKLVYCLKLKNNVFVHRDFHVSNLMLVNGQIGVIDSQDAVRGNKAYDVASLIDDVRIKTTKSLKNKIYSYYIKDQKKFEKIKFKNDFEIISVLRNLKIIGIFTRLAFRDNKKEYLKFIPYAWQLIFMRIKQNKIFYELESLLFQNFKKDLNEN